MTKQQKSGLGALVLLGLLAGCTLPTTNNDPPNLSGQIRGKTFTFQTGSAKVTTTTYDIVLFSTNAVDGLTTYPNVSFSLDKTEPART